MFLLSAFRLFATCRRAHGLMLWLALVVLLPAAATKAQLPTTELAWIYPPGGQQGKTIEVSVGGSNQDDLTRLVFSHAGIRAEQKTKPGDEYDEQPVPVNNQFSVAIDKSVKPGIYEVRVSGRFGTSNPRSFVIAQRNEVSDNGKNHQPAAAQEIGLGQVVNGRVDDNAVDYYRLPLQKGQTVLLDCLAQRIDSRVNATMMVLDPQGREVARNRDYHQLDPFIELTAQQDGDHVIGIFDVVYDGGAEHFYRLTAHNDPHIEFVFPPVTPAAEPVELSLYGRNLPSGQPAVGASTANGRPLQVVSFKPTLDDKFRRLISDSSWTQLLPTTSTLDLASYRVGDQVVSVDRSELPITVEHEPNNSPHQAQQVSAPCEVVGQFYPQRDRDFVQFQAHKGEVWLIEVISNRLGLDTDPVMVLERITKTKEGETVSDVATVDDPRNRNSSIGNDFDLSTDDPEYRLSVSQDAVYRIKLRDQNGDARRDPRTTYRLRLRQATPDFDLVARVKGHKVANNNVVPLSSVVVRPGAVSIIEVGILRQDGFNESVTLSLRGLPESITCADSVVPAGIDTGWLVLQAAPECRAWSGAIQIVGAAEVDEKKVERFAKPLTVTWGTGNRTQTPARFRATQDLVASVMDCQALPVGVKLGGDAVLQTSRGGKIKVPVQISRQESFKESMKFTVLGLPKQLKPKDFTIKPGNDGEVEVAVTDAKAQPGTYTFFLRCDTKVKIARNADAVARAEARQKRIDQALAKADESVKQLAAGQSETKAAVASLMKSINEHKPNLARSAVKVTELEAQHERAQRELAAAEKAASASPDDADGQARLSSAREQLAAADKALAEAKQQQANAQQQLSRLTQQSETAQQRQADLEKQLAAAKKQQQTATATKGQSDKQVSSLKKANQPKDVNVAVFSTQATLNIVDSPITIAATDEQVVKAGEKLSSSINLTRLFGFDGPIDIVCDVPKQLTGVKVAKIQIAKGKAAGTLEISTAETSPTGRHELSLRATGQFNKVPIETKATLKLVVNEP